MSRILSAVREAKQAALDHHAGKITLKSSTIKPSSPVSMPKSRVVGVRQACGMSQSVFARCLHISPRTLEKWEHGVRQPSGASAVLMALLEKHPKLTRELAGLR